MKVKITLLTLFLKLALGNTVSAQVPLVSDVENTGAGCTAPPLPAPAQLTNYANLPDPFGWSNGSGRVKTFEEWKCRRNEIKKEIEKYEIGVKPEKPANVTATYSGGTLTVKVTENGQTLTLTSKLNIPSGTGPFPAVIGMNAATGNLPASLFNGVIQIPYNHDQVVSYGGGSGSINSADPYFKLYPNTNIGKYSAWSWGISRLIDGLELVKSQINIDTKRIAITGCSYAGKMALFGGAFDERIALTIAQESGGGGVNSWRVSETIGNVEKIDNTNYSWFMPAMKTNFQGSNIGKLPHDHHELIAMIAPRAVLILGNPDYEWLGDESGYVSARAAQEVWKAMGVPERFGFSFRGGHSHCSLPSASNSEVTAFVDKFLRNSTTANTNIQVHSFNNTNYLKWIDAWDGYTLSFSKPDSPVVTITSPANGLTIEAPGSFTIAATVTDPDNDVSKVEFYEGTTKLGEDAASPYSLALDNLAKGTYSIKVVATDKQGNQGSSETRTVNVVSTYQIGKTTVPISIDGIIDPVWNNPETADIVPGNVLSGTLANPADLSGKFRALWDNTYLYILADVNDQSLNKDGTNNYDDDGVEVYLDINNDKSTTYGANDVQYTFGWNNGTTVGALPSGRSVAGITYKVVAKTGGYIVEARIPWSTVQATPAINQLIGIEFMINDDDNNGTRDKKIAWNAETDDAWQNPSLFDVAKLTGEVIITGFNDFNQIPESEIRFYPNPFTSMLTIETNGTFSYQVSDHIGMQVKEGIAENVLNFEDDLNKGVYFITIENESGKKTLKVIRQ
jgi:hypothetical protein